ncbi:alpha-terpineol synthase, chloroplastic-like [Aristolochia californica]|uniref:alpha-terpineol synthase, chloroplastic-like n=1 Tax=Aristolochia californica TaxID=171875 RepID=UPI0035DF189F
MALILHFSTIPAHTTSFPPRILTAPRYRTSRRISCTLTTQSSDLTVDRRTANYAPTVANNDFIQSLSSNFEGEKYRSRVEELTDYTKRLLESEKDQVTLLQLVDTLERLGLGYLFRDKINGVLRAILSSYNGGTKTDLDLYSTALLLRLSRQNGIMVEEDVFSRFMDEKGSFKASLCRDTKGNLSLYDASFLALEGEPILDEARAFSTKNLKDDLKGSLQEELKNKVVHALESPFHWSVTSLEARWFIEAYGKSEDKNPKLLELAKLAYNMRQAQYQIELKAASRWWTNTTVPHKLSFSRDRLAECFLWGLAMTHLPEYGYTRFVLTQASQLITTIDDTYDLYGSIDELERFTDVIERWDINAIDKLPQYMKMICFALFNSANELAYTSLKEQGWNIVPCLSKLWADLCKAYLKEAKWYNEGYMPTLDEYIENAVISISGSVMLGNAYFSLKANITDETLRSLVNLPEVIKWSSLILRLCDDLGTSMEEMSRGDVLKSIQSSMRDNGSTEDVARQHIRNLISDAWKKINKDLILESPFPRDLVDAALGLGRMSHAYYYRGDDGFGGSRKETFDFFNKLLVQPIPLDH